MIRPVIGITTNQDTSRQNAPYDTLSSAYAAAIQAAGGLPLLIPNELPLEALTDLRKHLDGVLLSGGGDIDPTHFNGIDHISIGGISQQRDELEISLVRLAVATDWPLLGICRGTQIINVAMGGTLYTDIPSQYHTELTHNTPLDQGRDFLAHEVTIMAESRLNAILGSDKLMVNSFHHQAIKNVAVKLTVSATAADGLVEGLELAEQRFFVGVQWHPECIWQKPEQQKLFKAFIRACQSA